MGPQFVAGPGALTTQAEGLASGLGGFQPFLQQAQQLTGPAAYQAYIYHLFNKMLLIQH